MSRIKETFANGKAFIPFITCGDPDLETTESAVRAAVENGANVLVAGSSVYKAADIPGRIAQLRG